jgi:hypothetical protein
LQEILRGREKQRRLVLIKGEDNEARGYTPAQSQKDEHM